MERLVLNKDMIVEYLKEFLELFYDIELEDIMYYNVKNGTKFFLSYWVIYHGKKEKVIKPFMTEDIIYLLRLSIRSKKNFINPVINLALGDEFKCKVDFKAMSNYSRRRKK